VNVIRYLNTSIKGIKPISSKSILKNILPWYIPPKISTQTPYIEVYFENSLILALTLENI